MEHIASCSHNKFLGIDSLIASQAVIFRINSGKENKKTRWKTWNALWNWNETNKRLLQQTHRPNEIFEDKKKTKMSNEIQNKRDKEMNIFVCVWKTLCVNKGWLNPWKILNIQQKKKLSFAFVQTNISNITVSLVQKKNCSDWVKHKITTTTTLKEEIKQIDNKNVELSSKSKDLIKKKKDIKLTHSQTSCRCREDELLIPRKKRK